MFNFGGKYWTEEDIAQLGQYYGSSTDKGLLEKFLGRTWHSITHKARRLGLRREVEGRDRYGRFVHEHRGWNKEKHLSEDHRKKIGQARKGKGKIAIPEEELRRLYLDQKLSTIKIAKLYGSKFPTILRRIDEYGIKRRNRSEALKGIIVSEEVRRKISERNKGRHLSLSTEFKKGHSPLISPKHQAENTKRLWKQGDYVKKQMMARHIHPNKTENKLTSILERNKLPFHYVGDGKVIIGGLCPDFIHNNGDNKKIIEVFGRVFHDPDFTFKGQIRWHQQYWGRMAYYSQFGYGCLIIWDDELVNEEKVVERVKAWA